MKNRDTQTLVKIAYPTQRKEDWILNIIFFHNNNEVVGRILGLTEFNELRSVKVDGVR